MTILFMFCGIWITIYFLFLVKERKFFLRIWNERSGWEDIPFMAMLFLFAFPLIYPYLISLDFKSRKRNKTP